MTGSNGRERPDNGGRERPDNGGRERPDNGGRERPGNGGPGAAAPANRCLRSGQTRTRLTPGQ